MANKTLTNMALATVGLAGMVGLGTCDKVERIGEVSGTVIRESYIPAQVGMKSTSPSTYSFVLDTPQGVKSFSIDDIWEDGSKEQVNAAVSVGDRLTVELRGYDTISDTFFSVPPQNVRYTTSKSEEKK